MVNAGISSENSSSRYPKQTNESLRNINRFGTFYGRGGILSLAGDMVTSSKS